MRRRGVLQIGVTGLAAMLVQGCAGGSTTPRVGGNAHGSGAAPVPSTGSTGFVPPAYVPAPVPIAELKKLFTYDSKSSFNATLTDKRTGEGVILEDITYSDTRRHNEIPAYIVGPAASTGRLPIAVFAHGTGATRDTFLAEASELARHGALAIVPELPLKPTGDPVTDSSAVLDAIVAQRRATDLMIRRSDADGSRVGFVGHSWGAVQGSVLCGIDNRLTAVALAAGASRFSQYLAVTSKPADQHAYLDALGRFDAVQYLPVAAKRTVLLQFGKQDAVLPVTQFTELTDATSGAKQRKDYDTGHDLVGFGQAVTDRLAFLVRVLRLK